jgi:hypothetical protein
MNRIGLRTIMCVMLIAALAITNSTCETLVS